MPMRNAILTTIMIMAAILLMAGSVAADHEDVTDEDQGVFHGWGTGPMIIVAIFVYWALAIPIALMVYTDANERRIDGMRWFWGTMVPFVGLAAIPFYVRARRGHPRVDIYDPWADGDRLADKKLAEGKAS
jgi:hypothetical protein